MASLRNHVNISVSHYLEANGWTHTDGLSMESFFYFIDPKTGLCHRSDFAWFIQSERDLNETLAARTKEQSK